MNKNDKSLWVNILVIIFLIANAVILTWLWINRATAPQAAGNENFSAKEPAFEFIIRELNLNKAQQNAYFQLRKVHQDELRPLIDSLDKARRIFFNLLKDSTADEVQQEAQSAVSMRLHQQVELANFRHFKQLRLICTTEQQRKFDAIIDEVLRRFGNRRPPPKDRLPFPGHPDGPPPPDQ